MIQFREVSKKFGDDTIVLDKVSFSLGKGSFTYLVGPTGAGKTTIFRLIIMDLLPSEGVILLGEKDITKIAKKEIPSIRRKVGVIFQDLKLLMDRTVLENVMVPLLFSGIPEKQAQDKAKEILISVGLEGKYDKFPLQISGGEKQRVAIARALVFGPEVILADEPTGNLDLETSYQIIGLLESINKKGTTVFMATHNEKVLEKSKQNVFSIKDKKIISVSTAK